MEGPSLILNSPSNRNNYLNKIKHFQDELFPHIDALFTSKTNKTYLPIVDYFNFSLNQLNNILTDFRLCFEEKEIFLASRHFITEKDKFVFDLHLKKMKSDFEINGNTKEANEVSKMLENSTIRLEYLNMKLGINYFSKLDEIVFKPLIWAFTNCHKEIIFYEELLIMSKKLEYLVREFFKIHLTSFYDIFSKYYLTNGEWSKIKKHMEVIVSFL